MLVILAFLVLIPNSKHLHLLLSPATVFLKAPILGTVPQPRFREGRGRARDGEGSRKKQVLDAFTCVECGRCQENCPAYATGKLLNPKKLILQNEEALLAGKLRREARRRLRHGRAVAVHDLRRLRGPVSGRHRAPAGDHRRPARAGLERRRAGVPRRRSTTTSSAAATSGACSTSSGRSSSRRPASRRSIPRSTSTWCGSAAPARSRPTSRSRCGRCSRSCARRARRSACWQGALHRRRRQAHRQRVHVPGARDRQRRGPEGRGREEGRHVVSALPEDARARLQGVRLRGRGRALGGARRAADARRHADRRRRRRRDRHVSRPVLSRTLRADTEEPRALLERVGADVVEPERNRDNPFCCGAGGGLLFEEHEAGKRISQERFEQLRRPARTPS